MKKKLIISSILIVVALLGLLAVPYIVDINDYKDDIVKIVRERSGKDIRVNGNMGIRILPDLAISLHDVSLGSDLKSDDSIVDIEKLILQLQIIPLLKGNVQIDSFILVSPTINYKILQNGKTNWDDLDSYLPEEEIAIEEDESDLDDIEETVQGVNYFSFFHFDAIKIKNGTFNLIDEPNDRLITFSNIDLDTSFSGYENDFRLSTKLDIFKNKSYGNINITGMYYIGDQQYGLQNLLINMDNIRGHGAVSYDSSSIIPEIKSAFNFDHLNLNHYDLDNLKIDKSKKEIIPYAPAPGYKSAGVFKWDEDEINFDFIKHYNAHFSFKTGGILYRDINVGRVMFNSYLSHGRLIASLKEAELFNGNVHGELVIDASGVFPKVKQDIHFEGVDCSLLPDRWGYISYLKGKIDGGIRTSSKGYSQKEIISNMKGFMSLKAIEGSLKGLDIFSMANNISSTLNIFGSLESTTKFDQISGDFDIKNGILSNSDFKIKSPIFNFYGKGKIDLPRLAIDFKLYPKMAKLKQRVARVPLVPISITGYLLHPDFNLEVRTIVDSLISNPKGTENLVKQLKEDFKGIKNSIKNDLSKDNILNDLKNIFGGF